MEGFAGSRLPKGRGGVKAIDTEGGGLHPCALAKGLPCGFHPSALGVQIKGIVEMLMRAAESNTGRSIACTRNFTPLPASLYQKVSKRKTPFQEETHCTSERGLLERMEKKR